MSPSDSRIRSTTVVPPPYRRKCAFPDTGRIPLGSILIVEPNSSLANHRVLTHVADEVRRLRYTCAASVVVESNLPDSPSLLGVVAVLRKAGASGLVASATAPENIADAVQTWILRESAISDDWLHFIDLLIPIPCSVRDPLGTIMSQSSEFSSVNTLLEQSGVSPRTLRERLSKSNLPSPGKWFIGARLVAGQFELIRSPRMTTNAIALKLGYSGASSMSGVVYRIFGVTLGRARDLLGLEWRVQAWFDWASED